jgi:uncharacterized hydantoinase/oxoprolinase family protein
MYSIIKKTKRAFNIVVAYIDIKGNNTIEGLNKWESYNYSNRQLYIVNNESQAKILIKNI